METIIAALGGDCFLFFTWVIVIVTFVGAKIVKALSAPDHNQNKTDTGTNEKEL